MSLNRGALLVQAGSKTVCQNLTVTLEKILHKMRRQNHLHGSDLVSSNTNKCLQKTFFTQTLHSDNVGIVVVMLILQTGH